MRQKDHEWTKARREWNKIWREVNEKNYYKSLDHQCFYFKQTDKKNLSPKGLVPSMVADLVVLLAEIKQKYQEQLKEKEKILQQHKRAEQEKDATLPMDKVSHQPQKESHSEQSSLESKSMSQSFCC